MTTVDLDFIAVDAQLQVLAMNFSNSFFSQTQDKYNLIFENSSVTYEMEALHTISTKLFNKAPNPGTKRDRQLIETIIYSYTYLITVYKEITKQAILSPNFKRYQMVKYLQDWCKETSVDNIREKQPDPDMMSKLSAIVEHINPTKEKKTEDELIRATAKAEIAKMLLKK